MLGCVTALSGCIFGGPLSNTADACTIFKERSSWYRAAVRSEDQWKIRVPILLAVIKKESSFQSDARPTRKKGFLGLPGPRPSTAYGYPQAKNETWNDYKKAIDNKHAQRDDFADAINFVGWYLSTAARVNQISRNSARNLYIAYHEGVTGYRRGAWRNDSFILTASAMVDDQAKLYDQQLQNCRRGAGRKYASRK